MEDFIDENIKRVNLRSFRKTIERYLKNSNKGGQLISFLEIDDETDEKGDFLEYYQKNPVYSKAIHLKLKQAGTTNCLKSAQNNLEEVIMKDKID